MRKYFRSPALMMTTMVLPLMQLIVLGYAFGGKIKNAPVAFVDDDHSVQSRKVQEMLNGITAGPQTLRVVDYDSLPNALDDLRTGLVSGVVQIPQGFSRRFYQHDRPVISFSEDNTDQFTASSVLAEVQGMVNSLNAPDVVPRLDEQAQLDVVEVYPYIEYAKYLLAGSTALGLFVVAMLGGGITFIDDKARGLHEGYLVTPVHKGELVLGLCFAGAARGIMSGPSLTIIGGMIAGIERLWDPVRLLYLILVIGVTSLCMISLMFLMMVRVSDPMVPRALFGVLNTLLFFPSGAIYPAEGFPWWLKAINRVDPFSYAVHALKNLLLKNTGFQGIYF